MQQFAPAEIYRGEKVGPGKYSVLLHAEFQSKERTLRDDEVAQWSEKIIAKLNRWAAYCARSQLQAVY